MTDKRSIPIRSLKRPYDHRQSERDTASRWRGCRNVMMVLGLVAGLVLLAIGAHTGYLTLCHSDLFQVVATPINDCRHINKTEVLRRVNVDIHTNMLALNTTKMRAALESHPWVSQASIERDWPNKLLITIREKKPVALLNRENGLAFLDQRGVIIAPVVLPDDINFPVITGLERLQQTDTSVPLQNVLRFLRYTDGENSFLNGLAISEIHVADNNDMVLYLLDRAFPIYLGGPTALRTKYSRLIQVLRDLYDNDEFTDIAHIRMEYNEDEVLVGKTGKTASG